jgi:hypothetical protein
MISGQQFVTPSFDLDELVVDLAIPVKGHQTLESG